MADDEFLDCRHAGRLFEPQLRECRSPKLIGLKQVTPEMCATCVYPHDPEDVGSASPPQRLTDCLYLSDDDAEAASRNTNGNGLKVLDTLPCHHPGHDRTTRQECRSCDDYQFPVLSPRLSVADCRRVRAQVPRDQPEGRWLWPNVQAAERELAIEVIDNISDDPRQFEGRGIVVIGGGKYFPSAHVTIRVLRHVNCRLPIQLWHLGGEVNADQQRLLGPYNVECVDADAIRSCQLYRFIDGYWWKGWQLKPYAILHCPFEEVLMLDADRYPVRDPAAIFEWSEYRRHGAVFWPDIESSLILLREVDVNVFGVPAFPAATWTERQASIVVPRQFTRTRTTCVRTM